MKTIKIAAVISVAVVLAASSSANAGGLLADTFIKPWNPGLAKAADQANAALGNPVDHAFAAGANTLVPGSGPVIEGYYAYNRGGVPGVVQQQTGINVGPIGGPIQQGPAVGGMMAPVSAPMYVPMQPRLGQFCATPVGTFGPGIPNVVGAPCNVPTPQGMFFGRIV